MSTDLDKFGDNLTNIRKRIEVIEEHLNGIRTTKYLVTEVEFLGLQFRKVLELIALSSLIANKEEYALQHAKFAKHYNARLIFQDLERLNKDFYPIPTNQGVHEINGERIFTSIPLEEGYLTKEDFLKIYEKCGGLLHAENPYALKKDFNKIREEFPDWLTKIKVLLSHHCLTLTGKEVMIIGILSDKNGETHATEFIAVSGEENIKTKAILRQSGVFPPELI